MTQSNWMNFRLLVLFRDGSSVEVFGWNGLKVFVNNALYSDFYAKYRRIEPEQAPLIQEYQLMGFALTRFLYVHGNVRSFIIIHCKI